MSKELIWRSPSLAHDWISKHVSVLIGLWRNILLLARLHQRGHPTSACVLEVAIFSETIHSTGLTPSADGYYKPLLILQFCLLIIWSNKSVYLLFVRACLLGVWLVDTSSVSYPCFAVSKVMHYYGLCLCYLRNYSLLLYLYRLYVF